jgi:hypothetical protein
VSGAVETLVVDRCFKGLSGHTALCRTRDGFAVRLPVPFVVGGVIQAVRVSTSPIMCPGDWYYAPPMPLAGL